MGFDRSILERYHQGTCTDAEKALVEAWFDDFEGESDMDKPTFLAHLESLDKKFYSNDLQEDRSAPAGELETSKEESKKVFPMRRILTIAASLVVLFGLGLFLKQTYFTDRTDQILAAVKSPSKSNAVIVLDNKQEYNLDSLGKGDTLAMDQYLITKLESGEIQYILKDDISTPVYHTIRTKAGGTANLVLADGSKVWLNVNSELKYPLDFEAESRDVFLEGEGYFEVAKKETANDRIPFYVHGKEHTVSVLGTKFNANFERAEVALLEGKVGVSRTDNFIKGQDNFLVTLLPNQVFKTDKAVVAKNIEEYIDWKEGYFNLNNQTLGELSKKISAWYGVEIEVDKSLEDQMLFGRISRDKNLKEVMELIANVLPISYKHNNLKLFIQPK